MYFLKKLKIETAVSVFGLEAKTGCLCLVPTIT